MIDAVIFDIDGTLLDSNDLHAAAWQETFRHFGKEVPIAELRSQIGKGADQYIPYFWGREEAAKRAEEMAEYRTGLYSRNYINQAKPFPGVRPLFQRLKKDGKRIALASSSKKSEVAFYEKLLEIEDLLDTAISADEACKSKPFPDIFAAALKGLGQVSSERAIVVGDTPFDGEAAAKIGISFIGMLCGGFPEMDLRKSGAAAVYRDPADLLSHYENSPVSL